MARSALRSAGDKTLLWFAYPKKSGPLKSGLSRDSGWDPVSGRSSMDSRRARKESDSALARKQLEAPVRQVVTSEGFTGFRRAAETPFNIVYEAQP